MLIFFIIYTLIVLGFLCSLFERRHKTSKEVDLKLPIYLEIPLFIMGFIIVFLVFPFILGILIEFKNNEIRN